MIYTHKVNGEAFKGYIKVEIPSFVERMKLAKEVLHDYNEGKMVEKSDIDKSLSIIDATIKRVVEVKINVKSESPIEDIETLSYYAEGVSLISELGNFIINGIPLEKN